MKKGGFRVENKNFFSKNKFAFTLVEMVVVVMIIIILATIAFLRLWNYSSEANLAKRASDKKNIEEVLDVYKLKNGEYPEFDEENGEKIFWPIAWGKVKTNLPELPIDPITKKYYKIDFIATWKYGRNAFVDLWDNKKDIFYKWEVEIPTVWITSPYSKLKIDLTGRRIWEAVLYTPWDITSYDGHIWIPKRNWSISIIVWKEIEAIEYIAKQGSTIIKYKPKIDPEYNTEPKNPDNSDNGWNINRENNVRLIVTKWVDQDNKELKPSATKAPKYPGGKNEAFEPGKISWYVYSRTETDNEKWVVTHIFVKDFIPKPPEDKYPTKPSPSRPVLWWTETPSRPVLWTETPSIPVAPSQPSSPVPSPSSWSPSRPVFPPQPSSSVPSTSSPVDKAGLARMVEELEDKLKYTDGIDKKLIFQGKEILKEAEEDIRNTDLTETKLQEIMEKMRKIMEKLNNVSFSETPKLTKIEHSQITGELSIKVTTLDWRYYPKNSKIKLNWHSYMVEELWIIKIPNDDLPETIGFYKAIATELGKTPKAANSDIELPARLHETITAIFIREDENGVVLEPEEIEIPTIWILWKYDKPMLRIVWKQIWDTVSYTPQDITNYEGVVYTPKNKWDLEFTLDLRIVENLPIVEYIRKKATGTVDVPSSGITDKYIYSWDPDYPIISEPPVLRNGDRNETTWTTTYKVEKRKPPEAPKVEQWENWNLKVTPEY